jgi:hypothetical protein
MLVSGVATGVRDLVADSWLRSMAAGINVDASEPPITLDEGLLNDYRAEHPLSPIFPVLYDEEHAGTNAPGTALRLDAPVTISSAEHFVRPVQRWSCAAAPIHDPVTRRILGVVDVTGGDDIGSPQTIAMIRAAARMAESELACLDASRQASTSTVSMSTVALVPGWHPGRADGLAPGRLHLRGLGRPDVVVSAGQRSLRLSPRHSEIVVVLAARPDGVSGDELGTLLYPGDVTSSTSTLRAEMVRLRALLGGEALASRPYRLTCDVSSDWAAVSALLAAGDVTTALRGYHGPLLPPSEAPGVVRLRGDLHDWLRAMILADGRHELLVSWTQSRWGAEDLPMWQRQCAVLPASSPLRPRAEAAAARLDAELRG